ncbi:hypothetical protein [Nakamurella leprariae]|uniref:Uncharacterized protein n=1 Tax=Nakamurella leprariae TaxID=2803911 RepID=A0A938Y4U6_9ACTN|nr:hypothetical protein [Nakamurella leprariae]MBM9466081.1 hypothetical protein [Nakamurella leprariae]
MTEFRPVPFDPEENAAALVRNAAEQPQRLRELADRFDLLDVSNELDDILKGIAEGDRSPEALALGHALVAFLRTVR